MGKHARKISKEDHTSEHLSPELQRLIARAAQGKKVSIAEIFGGYSFSNWQSPCYQGKDEIS